MTVRHLAGRIDGLDVARAVAVLGMVAAHVGDDGTRGGDTEGWRWLMVSHGFPSALFAVLAGASMTLMLTRRGAVPPAEVERVDLSRTRVRVAVRGGLLILLGLMLETLQVPIAIILHHLGLMFLLALPVLRWRTRWLVSLAVALAVSGGWITRALDPWAADAGLGDAPVIDTLWDGSYPAATWMAYILTGIVIGRLDLRADAVAGRLAAFGAVVLVTVSAAAVGLRDVLGAQPDWLGSDPHSFTPVEAGRNIGAALLVVGACLWLARLAPRVLWPLMATGSMALTVYVLQVIVVAAIGDWTVREPSNVVLVAMWAGAIAFASAWRRWVGQGPLERMLTAASTAAADELSPTVGAGSRRPE